MIRQAQVLRETLPQAWEVIQARLEAMGLATPVEQWIDSLRSGATDYVLKTRMSTLVPAVERVGARGIDEGEVLEERELLPHEGAVDAVLAQFRPAVTEVRLLRDAGGTWRQVLATDPVAEPNADPQRVSLYVEYTTTTKG